ncbi:SusC/RagA family TonB-linked outer membrane protein [Bacteroides propionicifaciens]|uniref:SusC/RagA family TonB-linked outer membrane protein n=1 Tax=Bacteroides propionicifaciens TaxID=392838 RepID=UPI00036A04A1|nr:TonB-dependent receptor [Bacteroides propionicifaciens]
MKRLFKKSILLICFTLLVAICSNGYVYAEEKGISNLLQEKNKVTGVVADPSGEPIIGATVMIVGTTQGTTTDIDGKFAIDIADSKARLEVRFLGYVTQTIQVGSQRSINVVLKDDTQLLDEVVVVGYGTQKKETLTGAITVVDSKTLEDKGALSSPLQALQGQVPGVIITRSSSAPGDESWDMTLRGAVSKNASKPLVIIDGIEYESMNELRLLNPSDIESINFLKDASAAIYGSKAAGGVVLVQTKQAKAGKTKIEYSGSVTGKFVGLSPEMMSLSQWSDAVITARTNDGYTNEDVWMKYAKLAKKYQGHYIDLDHSLNPINGAFSDVADYVFFDTDWNDIMWGSAASTQHELSVSGGGDKSTYRMSLGYMYDDSNLKWGENNNNRYNLRLSNTFKLTDALTLQSVIAYNRQDQVAPTQVGSTLATSVQQPGFPSSTIDGEPYAWGTWGAPNWYAELGGENKLKVSAINISETFSYNLTKELTAVATLGYNTSTATRDAVSKSIDWYNYAGNRIVRTAPNQTDSYYEKSSSRTDFYSVSGYLEWSKTIAKDHEVKLMGGAQYNLKEYDYVTTNSRDILPSLEVINGSGVLSYGANKWREAVMSYYGRANYAFQSKYLLEGMVRHDGSSKFQPENRWATFWGVSGGWRISEEAFMKDTKGYIDNLKLRASYGNVGNQSGIDRYDGVQLYNFEPQKGALVGNGKLSYINTNGKLVSSGRTWEKIHNYNIGLDFGFLNGRLNGTIEYFWKNNNNMLIASTYPSILGDESPTNNQGEFKANGFEGSFTWSDKIGPIKYHIGANYTYANNELVNNGGNPALSEGIRSDREGYPLNSVFGFRYAGKIQNKEQLEKYVAKYKGNSPLIANAIGSLRLGDNMFQDINGDGAITVDDLVYLGTDDPKISYSFNAGLEWNGFDLSAVFQGVAKRTIMRDGVLKIPMYAVYQNSTTQSIGDVWSPEHRGARYPQYTNNGNLNKYNYFPSSWSAEDGSYIRLKNITLGYTLPEAWLAKTKALSKVRLYLTGTDLWEHTKVTDGWDPEAISKVGDNKNGLKRYPFTRSVTVGASVTF